MTSLPSGSAAQGSTAEPGGPAGGPAALGAAAGCSKAATAIPCWGRKRPCWAGRWPKIPGFQWLEGWAGTADLSCCHGAAGLPWEGFSARRETSRQPPTKCTFYQRWRLTRCSNSTSEFLQDLVKFQKSAFCFYTKSYFLLAL